MANLPFPLTGESLDDVKSQVYELIRSIYEEKIGGADLGDVFSLPGDVLTLALATPSGLTKAGNLLAIDPLSTGGLQILSTGLSIKTLSTGGLETGATGLGIKLDGTSLSLSSAGLKAVGTGSGDVIGPVTNKDGYIPQWDGADSKTLKDSGLFWDDTNNSLLDQLGIDTNLPPRMDLSSLTISRQIATGTDSIGLDIMVQSAAHTSQVIWGISSYLQNYGDYGTGDLGAGVGVWSYIEAYGTGEIWGFATYLEDKAGSDASMVGMEIQVARQTACTDPSIGLALVAGVDGSSYPVTYAINLAQFVGSTGTFQKGLYAAQSAIGTGVSDSFIELLNYFRVKRDGSISIGGSVERATTVGTAFLNIFNGTAPIGTLANGCSIYSSGGKLYAMDASGAATQLTP